MGDNFVALLKASGKGAGALALASWGFYELRSLAGIPSPFQEIAGWLCIAAIAIGVVALAIRLIKSALLD